MKDVMTTLKHTKTFRNYVNGKVPRGKNLLLLLNRRIYSCVLFELFINTSTSDVKHFLVMQYSQESRFTPGNINNLKPMESIELFRASWAISLFNSKLSFMVSL